MIVGNSLSQFVKPAVVIEPITPIDTKVNPLLFITFKTCFESSTRSLLQETLSGLRKSN